MLQSVAQASSEQGPMSQFHSVDDWMDSLAQRRQQFPAVQRVALEKEYIVLRRRLRHVTSRLQSLRTIARKLLDQSPWLCRVMDDTDRLAAAGCAEMERSTNISDPVLPTAILCELLDRIEYQAARFARQWELWTRHGDLAARLEAIVVESVGSRQPDSRPVVRLTRELRWKTDAADTFEDLISLAGSRCGFDAQRVTDTPFCGTMTHGHVTDALPTARMAGGIVRRWPSVLPTRDERVDLLIMAALLRDIGFATFNMSPCQSESEQTSAQGIWCEKQHPAIGAALVGRFQGLPVELRFLIAQHHERLDGSGFPRNLKRPRLSWESRLLAVVVRFVELYHSAGVDECELTTAMDRQSSAGDIADAAINHATFSVLNQLIREARHGELDSAIIEQLCRWMAPHLLTSFSQQLGNESAHRSVPNPAANSAPQPVVPNSVDKTTTASPVSRHEVQARHASRPHFTLTSVWAATVRAKQRQTTGGD